MKVGKIMHFLTRDSIQWRRDMESSRLAAVVENHYSVGYVVRTIVEGFPIISEWW